ncbi:MAG: hypothetical protein RBR15_13235 [Sphaerochaeta sp.]|nr:hypothetical protein [Sphaerochaeta sp.]
MKEERKKKLMQLGADSHSDALLDMARSLEQVDDRVNQMVSTQEENIRAFRKKLSGLRRSTKFNDWRQSSHLADSLSQLLDGLEACSPEPCLGVELVADFYETDSSVFEYCDEAKGSIGSVYSIRAKDLFIEYAQSCRDKKTIVSILMRLCQNDRFGVRTSLMDSLSTFLDEQTIRTMIGKLQALAVEEDEEVTRNYYQNRVLSCASQIKDAQLFEKTLLGIHGKKLESIIEIAQFHLKCDDVEAAFAWIQKFPNDRVYLRKRYLSILTEIYRRQGDKENLAIILRKRLRKLHVPSVLQELLDVVGEGFRAEVIAGESSHILNDSLFCLSNLAFLLEVGELKDAEAYLFARTDEIAGMWHNEIIPIATTFEEHKSFLASTVIYRALLDFILENGDTPFYPDAVAFLKKLDALSPLVPDWLSFADHAAYKGSLLKIHGRKRNFWAQHAG